MFGRLIKCVLIGLLATSICWAQESRGKISGRVTDAKDAPIAGAQVQVTNTQTGVVIAAQTNGQGIFTVPFLVPSVYSVAVEHPGFKKLVHQSVTVQVGSQVQLDLTLAVGEVSQQIEVTAAPPLLHTGTASLGLVVGTKEIEGMPNASGNVGEWADLTPGVASTTSIAIHYAAFNNGTSSLSADGNSIFANEWTIDGVPNMFASGTVPRVAFSPPPMAISEFKVMTVFYDAALGHTSGAIINMNTRSGTDQYHGELHEFLGNSALNSNLFFAKRAGQKKTVYQANRYGGAFGGPVLIPHIYNGNKGSKKTFFYYVYEGNKWGVPGTFTGTVPTAAERTGDFSALLSLGPSYTIYNPYSTVALGNGLYQRTPFQNNVIPTNLLNSTALKIINLYPLPNTTGTAGGDNNYVLGDVPANEKYWTNMVRFDHNFSDRSRMFLRMDYDDWNEREAADYGQTNPAAGNHDGRNDVGIAIDEVYDISPSAILDFRYGMTAQEFPNMPLNPTNLSSYGFSQGFTSLFPTEAAFPLMNFASYSLLGDGTAVLGYQSSLIHSFSGSITQLIRSHTLHYGLDFRIERANGGPYTLNNAYLNFNSTYTNGPYSTSPASAIGQDMASFMMGIPGTGGTVTTNSSYADQDLWGGAYLQDDWRVTPRLTMNLGLRLEHETPVTERYNRAVSGFDDTSTNPISAAATANYAANPMPGLDPSDFKVLGGLRFAGGPNGRSFWHGQKIEVMPRIGLAFHATPNTVLRGGYGLFYDTIGVYRSPALQTGYSSVTPILSSLDNGVTYSANLTDPVPNGLIAPLGSSGGLSTALGQSLSVYAIKRSIPYSQRWSFTVERELPSSFILNLSYVGNYGLNLPISQSINNTPASYLSTLPTRDQTTINYLNESYPNPFYGLAPSYTETDTRAGLLTPYPEFGAITVNTDKGWSNYNALQVELNKRFSHGYSVNAAYTYSRLMDAITYLNNTDPSPWYGVSANDRPQQLSISNLLMLPIGQGKLIGSTMPKWADYAVGGWQLNSIVTYLSGDALTWGNDLYTGSGNIAFDAGKRSINEWFNTSGFVTASSQQLADNIRKFPLRLSNVRGPGQYLWDLAVNKDIPIHHRFTVQMRGEAYNAFNHVNFKDPSLTPTSSAFGKITGTNGYAREINVALRVLF